MKKRCDFKIKQKRIDFSSFLLAFVAVFFATIGFLGTKLAVAFPGDQEYWTTSYDGLSMTVVSAFQNGTDLVPIDDGEGGYYFRVSNNTEPVRVGIRVDGITQGDTYYYYPTSNWWMDGRQNLSPADNGTVIYEELRPQIAFDDTYYLSGQYYISPSVGREQGSGVQKNIIVRPTAIGSQNIDIISVKQNNVELALTNNEYQIPNYNAPITVTYKLKNLLIGNNYSVNVGHSDYYQFKAEATEVTDTREIALDLTAEHASAYISLYDRENDQVDLYFRVVDANFAPLGDIIIDGINQGGQQLVANVNNSGWRREYTFTVNDAQGLEVMLHTTRATANMNYYITYSISGNGGGYLYSDEPLVVAGEDLELQGVPLLIPAIFGLQEYSPFTLSISINTVGADFHGYNQQRFVYQQYAEPQTSSDVFYLVVYEDNNIPRFDASMFYSDGTRIDGDVIDPARHDATHPLQLEVRGERYNNSQTYDIVAKTKENGEVIYSRTFTVTGAELNSGVAILVDGLTLTLPEFDPDEGSSGYEKMYDFSLEIDGLRQGGTMYYLYEGWVSSILTYDGGDVVAMGAGGGIGGSMFVTSSGATVRRSSFDVSKSPVLHYLGNGFDDSVTYNYTLYYNGDTDEEWWSAPAGTVVDEGTLTGAELNRDGYSVNLVAPNNDSDGVMYTLVLEVGDGLVKVIHDNYIFTEEPKIESFRFSADSDSFMQTGWSSYRVAINTDVQATLTGDGFDDGTNYKLWVGYDGYRFGEEDEYGYRNPEPVDLSNLDGFTMVTGAQLNAGYTYNLDYNNEAFDGVNNVEVGFMVSDSDVDEPDWHGGSGNGSYTGHNVNIEYVNDDEVFRDDGFQVNNDGTITDVSQPDEPHGEILVDIRTPDNVNVIVEGGTLTVISEMPVVVVGLRNGEWVKLYEWDVTTAGEQRTNHYSIGDCDQAIVALKGNLTGGDGTIDLLDSNVIYRSLLNPSSPAYRALTPIEMILADLNGDSVVDLLDANVIYRSLLSPSSPAYQEISW
ncbi:hypothetical protein J5868_00450 [Candidatus Saccharibacteria bacterium]|nr:hypothetical protein [Candidatus Saccharibacteria bacterium]